MFILIIPTFLCILREVEEENERKGLGEVSGNEWERREETKGEEKIWIENNVNQGNMQRERESKVNNVNKG